MSHLSFAEYLERRRPSYTKQWLSSAFLSSVSSRDIETYLNDRDAPLGAGTLLGRLGLVTRRQNGNRLAAQERGRS